MLTMLHNFYNKTYDLELDATRSWGGRLDHLVDVHAIADKYEVDGLMQQACVRLEFLCGGAVLDN